MENGHLFVNTEKRIVALKGISGDYDLLVVTKNGIIIRTDIKKISVIGRNTQGVKIISLEELDSVIDISLCERYQDVIGSVENDE